MGEEVEEGRTNVLASSSKRASAFCICSRTESTEDEAKGHIFLVVLRLNEKEETLRVADKESDEAMQKTSRRRLPNESLVLASIMKCRQVSICFCVIDGLRGCSRVFRARTNFDRLRPNHVVALLFHTVVVSLDVTPRDVTHFVGGSQ